MDRFDRLPMQHLESEDFEIVQKFYNENKENLIKPKFPMIYAFIPARSGSKKIKDKNYLMLKDKRLFEWSIECIIILKKIEKIIFSTDSNKYIEYAKSIRLDKELIIDYNQTPNSSSEIKIFDYLKSDFIKNNTYLNENDSLLMLLPTQPFE